MDAKQITVAFSGFKEDSPYNDKLKQQLKEKILLLGANLWDQDTFSAKITHIVCPPRLRSIKTIYCAVVGRWIMNPQWISDSFEANYFVDEHKYGFRNTSCFLLQKKIHITPEFSKENANQKGFDKSVYPVIIEKVKKKKLNFLLLNVFKFFLKQKTFSWLRERLYLLPKKLIIVWLQQDKNFHQRNV